MQCPNCHSVLSSVVKTTTRTLRYRDGTDRTIRQRRRQCIHCGTRFTTTERTQGGGDPPPDSEADAP